MNVQKASVKSEVSDEICQFTLIRKADCSHCHLGRMLSLSERRLIDNLDTSGFRGGPVTVHNYARY